MNKQEGFLQPVEPSVKKPQKKKRGEKRKKSLKKDIILTLREMELTPEGYFVVKFD